MKLKKLLLVSASIFTLGIGGALADGNQSTIDQIGSNNNAAVDQTGWYLGHLGYRSERKQPRRECLPGWYDGQASTVTQTGDSEHG